MESLKIDTGVKQIQINDGPDFIEFNPSDVAWAERFQGMRRDLFGKIDEFSKRAKELEAQRAGADEALLDEIEKQGNALRREMCVYMRGRIDEIFGKGTSQKCFGDLMSENAITSFLEGVTPFIQTARAAKVAAYVPHPQTKKRGKAVMK